MKKALLSIALLITAYQFAAAQLSPEITSWVINPGSDTGYAGILSNVQTIQYSTNNVYVSCSCIPGYSIGPWNGNPNIPVNQNFVYKITLSPQKNTGTLTAVGLGHIGVWSNGVSIFNADDGMTYNNQGVWHRNALVWEGISFDNCLGHPQQQGEYHHHVNPKCLYDDTDSTHHSPIIGYAFDGFPVYGAYGYADTNGTGPIVRMTSSYQLRNITVRDTLPDGTAASSAGPPVNTTYPIGSFIQDYIFVPQSGSLDNHNGRFCVTPEYPGGTYAYFVSIDSTRYPVYPFVLGPTYYGVVTTGNTGPGGGHVTISETTTVYNPATGTNDVKPQIKYKVVPNPAGDYAFIYFDPASANNIKGTLYDVNGQLLQTINNLQPSIAYTLDLSKYSTGTYFLHLETADETVVEKILKVK